MTPELSATLADGSALLLRPPREADVAVLHGLLASPDVGRWFHPRTLEQAHDEWLDPQALAWALEVDGRCVGLVQVEEEDDPDYRHAALQVFVAPDVWGRGIAAASLTAACDWLVGPRGHHRLTLDPERANGSGLRLAERLGFRRVGVLERDPVGPRVRPLGRRGADGAGRGGGVMSGFGVLRGQRVVLRPVDPGDAEELDRIHRARGRALVGRAGRRLAAGRARRGRFGDRGRRRVVGFATTYEKDNPRRRFAGLDLFLDPATHGQGYGLDAVEAIVGWLHATRHHRIVVDPAADNAAAIACYAKAGFRAVGLMHAYERDRTPGPDGGRGWHDGLLMEHVLPAGEEVH